MTRFLTVGLIAAVALAIAGDGATRPPGTADDCTLGAHVFAYWGGGDVEAQGRIECSSPHAWISVSAVVTRDGAFVASGEHRCTKATTCRRTLAPLDDPDGDQRWCVEVRGDVQGGRALGPQSFCEEFDAI